MVSKDSVNYRQGDSLKRCVFCVMYQIGGTCTLVEGQIKLLTVCDRFA